VVTLTVWVILSIVQDRGQCGAIGWCIPYEFNQSDLEASLTFLETHCSNVRESVSWATIQYMVTEVQYGGRITDDRDRRLFQAFGRLWLCEKKDIGRQYTDRKDQVLLGRSGTGAKQYDYYLPVEQILHEGTKYEQYLECINSFPNTDSPKVFGLHENADLTYGENMTSYLLDTITETRPKESGSSDGGLTVEQKVTQWAKEHLELMPPDYDMGKCRRTVITRPNKSETFKVLGREPQGPKDPDNAAAALKDPTNELNGMNIPLNMFLYQEIERMDLILRIVRQTLNDLILAIRGEIIMTPQLQDALTQVSIGKPPEHWYKDASGAFIAWTTPSLPMWFDGLLKRVNELTTWLNSTRPVAFWLTGFFNPSGFLTCLKQEVTRRNRDNKWGLDEVVLFPTIHNSPTPPKPKKDNKKGQDGLYIHGLYVEGARFVQYGDKKENSYQMLEEPIPKEIYCPVNPIFVNAKQSSFAKEYYLKNRSAKEFWYDCPVYTIRGRTDLGYVDMFKVRAHKPSDHWTVRGVALLCSID
jgi:dynein heavy chain